MPRAGPSPISPTEGYVISDWIDAPVKRVVIVEVEREE
jgi:hypothetical protein